MSTYDGGSIYSPETMGSAAGDHALVLRQQEHQQLVLRWQQQRQQEQEQLNQLRQQAAQQMAVARQQQADSWAERDRLSSERRNMEHEIAVLRRDKELVLSREQQIQEIESKRRRNRSNSEAYIEDTFATLSPRYVVDLLTNASARIREHAMSNISTCINTSAQVAPPFVRFKPEDVAPFLLPKLHQLVATSKKPLEPVWIFCQNIISNPSMAKAIAMSGECPRLADYLIEHNGYVNQLAIACFRQMLRMDAVVIKAAYSALATAIPHIPVTESTAHPAVAFVEEVTPKIVEDCFHNGLWSAISPLVTHKITSLRRVALSKIVLEAQSSDRTQHGLVTARILELLDRYYQSPSPPPDVVEFFTTLLPILAVKLCRDKDHINWLLVRLSDPNPRINDAVVQALRVCGMKQEPVIHDVYVKADLLRRLDEPPTQPSFAVTKLICDLLPVLAEDYARQGRCLGVLRFLDHAEIAISSACLIACTKIVNSTVENRSNLHSVFLKLNFEKESTLMLCDIAMPVLCKDWAAAGQFAEIAKILFHPERRIRLPAHHVWEEIVSNTPSARSKIIKDDLLSTFFFLCDSPLDDCVVLGYRTLPYMAKEISKSGISPTRQVVQYLNHPLLELRKAAIRCVLLISEAGDSDRDTLLAADAFSALKLALQSNPHDSLDSTYKILTSLAPSLSTRADACAGLLQLLDSQVPQVEHAVRSALAAISYTNINYRETLRKVILDGLVLASDPVLTYSTKAIQEWIGQDLAQLNDFTTFFDLVCHSDKRIQNGALYSLKQRIQSRDYEESLVKADIVTLLRNLANTDNSEAINFVSSTLPKLAVTLARHGYVPVLIQFLAHNEPKMREGASAAVEAIALGPDPERKNLVSEDILERYLGSSEALSQITMQMIAAILPSIAFDYLHAKKITPLFQLVEHPQQAIRLAATKAVTNIVATGTTGDRMSFRDALLPRLDNGSPALYEVASGALLKTLVHDSILRGEYKPLLRLFNHEDSNIRAVILSEFHQHIENSDETIRKSLVDAAIIPILISALKQPKEDLVLFAINDVLPAFGSSLSHSDGTACIFPLLSHQEPRIRLGAVAALRNGVDSRYGNVQKMVAAGVVSFLYSLIDEDDIVRGLWCYILPKAAPFLTGRTELDLLFECLGDTRPNIQEAASEAISRLSKTSEETRVNLFPALLNRLDGPPSHALEVVAQAVSLSGLTFVSNGQESKLLALLEDTEPALLDATLHAINHILLKGGNYEHQKLLDAGIFAATFKLYNNPVRRRLALSIFYNMIPKLGHAFMLNESEAEELFSLFDDPDTELAQVLYQSLADDPQVLNSSILPDLVPLLLNHEENPSVAGLLSHLAPYVVSRLLALKRIHVIMRLLSAREATVSRSYLKELHECVINSTEDEKDLLAGSNDFIPVLSEYLKTRDVILRRISSEIVEVLSNGSERRSSRMMQEGVGSSLAWVAVNGETNGQRASIYALDALFHAAPDHADQLVWDCLPALRDIMEDLYRSHEVYSGALSFLADICKQSANSRLVVESDITPNVVMWLSPQHSIKTPDCQKFIFQITERIARNSDLGRKILISSGVLPVLIRLLGDYEASNVINACHILNALAHTGTCRKDITALPVKEALQRITSLTHRSKISSKSERKAAQEAAKRVLATLKSTKNVTQEEMVFDSPLSAGRLLERASSDGVASRLQRSFSASLNGGRRVEPVDGARNHFRRSVSESDAEPVSHLNPINPHEREREQEQELGLGHSHTRHSRALSLPARNSNGRLSIVHEGEGEVGYVEEVGSDGLIERGYLHQRHDRDRDFEDAEEARDARDAGDAPATGTRYISRPDSGRFETDSKGMVMYSYAAPAPVPALRPGLASASASASASARQHSRLSTSTPQTSSTHQHLDIGVPHPHRRLHRPSPPSYRTTPPSRTGSLRTSLPDYSSGVGGGGEVNSGAVGVRTRRSESLS